MLAAILAVLKDNAIFLTSLAAIGTIIEIIFAPFRTLAGLWRKPVTVFIANPEALHPPKPRAPPPGTIQLDPDTFVALQTKLRATIGTAHPAYAIRLNNLAGVVRAQGRFAEADAFYAEALTIARARLSDTHPDTQTCARNHLGLLEAHIPNSPAIPALKTLLGR